MEVIKIMFCQVLNSNEWIYRYVFFSSSSSKGTLQQAVLSGFNISLKVDKAKSSEMLEW